MKLFLFFTQAKSDGLSNLQEVLLLEIVVSHQSRLEVSVVLLTRLDAFQRL